MDFLSFRRHQPQVAHAVHHRQAADAAVLRPVRPGAGHRAPENRGPRQADGPETKSRLALRT